MAKAPTLQTCPRCQSNKLMPQLQVLDNGMYSIGDLRVFFGYSNPKALLRKGEVFGVLRATICGECGLAELTVKHPSALYLAWQKAQAKARER
ncbi:MAG TPA: hypothetical protein VK348_14095 [Planctomycetota bacterium]|nr:hypothetical protein [Planctomycetota bacterium]